MTSTPAPRHTRTARRPGEAGDSWLLIGAAEHPASYQSVRLHWRDRILVRWGEFSLDAKLASGFSPDAERLLALRARALVSLETRLMLANDWDHLLTVAPSRSTFFNARVPICRDRVLAAESEIRQMMVALRAPLPVPVRGVAMASHLLTDGAGPIYSRRSVMDLSEMLRSATRHMDPTADLLA